MTKEEIIYNLDRCYHLKDALIQRNIQIPQDLFSEIADYEKMAFDALAEAGNSQDEGVIIGPNNTDQANNRRLRVVFPDGQIFQEPQSVNTFLKTLQYIGLSKVAEVGVSFQGYNLVDTRKRIDNGNPWQKQVDGYWVYTYLNGQAKAKSLIRINDYFRLGIKILALDIDQ